MAMPMTVSPRAITRGRPLSDLRADTHRGDIAHPHRRTVLRRDDDVFDVGDRADEADAAQQLLLAAALEVGATGVHVVALERLDHLVKS